MSQQTLDLVQLIASLAGSFLLGLVFVGLVALCVLLWLGGRAVKIARGHVPAIAKQILDRTALVEARTKVEAEAIIRPQIEAVSALAGVQAGARALLRGTPASQGRRLEPPPPTQRAANADVAGPGIGEPEVIG